MLIIPLLCLVESSLTQSSECILKCKIICYPKSTLITKSDFLPQEILYKIQEVCATCVSLGNTDNVVKQLFIDTATPQPFLIQG